METFPSMDTINPQDESFLARVPIEMLLRITRWIRTEDLANVRLSCKLLERNLFNFFAHEFFRKRQFMVSSQSLQALVDISKHSTLAPFLKHVIICTDRPGNRNIYQPQPVPEKLRIYRRLVAEQENLLTMGIMRDMLAEAFAALPHLEIVDLRDFNSPSRHRDNGVWRSYGSKTLEESLGEGMQTAAVSGYMSFPTQIFTAIIAALGASGAQPKNIETLIRNRNWGLRDSAFAIPPRLDPKLGPILANLETLHLCFDFEPGCFMIQGFLTMARNVRWLRLNFNSTPMNSTLHSAQEPTPALFNWLAHPESDNSIDDFDKNPVSFPNLERFDIGNATMTASAIVKVVAKFSPTLEHLSLRRVSVCDSPRDVEDKTNPWLAVFNKINKIRGIHLRVLELSDLHHGDGRFSRWDCPISFKADQEGVPKTRGAVLSWMGTTDRVSLGAMIKSVNENMICSWPDRRTYDSEMELENDMDEDEEEDMDEDEQEDMDEEEEVDTDEPL
ncbi:hypothetical protein QBC41DRAFT_369139 [Cercophora samala]|uniref:F-box domain-containing protein n=1 Tax=Cercophora samala TaxID=330535 RepID=A0AA39YTR5_9PEZI|nr:hypothetical protein QBC41DRAFT_369139 [Cercophora samala]